MRVYLLQTDAREETKLRTLTHHVYRCVKSISLLNSMVLKGTPGWLRSIQLTCDITKAFDDLTRLRQYRPPLGLRYASTLFVYMVRLSSRSRGKI